MCEFRSHQYQSRRNAPKRGSIHAVRRIPDPSAVVLSAAQVAVPETTIEDVGVCDESVTEVDLPVVSSAATVSVCEETTTKDVDVCKEYENVVDILVAVSSTQLVSVFEEISMDVDVCEKSEIEVDISATADYDSLQTNPGNDAVPSKPIKSLTATEPGLGMRPPEVGFEEHAIQVRIGSESGRNVGGLEGEVHDDIEPGGVKEGVFVDGAIGSCSGRKVVDESMQSCRSSCSLV